MRNWKVTGKRWLALLLTGVMISNGIPVMDYGVVEGAEYYQELDEADPVSSDYSSAEFENAYTYTGNDLGANWSQTQTEFKLWAPTADTAVVRLYQSGNPGTADLIKEIPMTKGEKGLWSAVESGDLNGTYYTYKVSVNGQEVEACDPYAKAAGINGDRGMVIDLNSTNPDGWEQDTNPHSGKDVTDAVIYELSVRDFSMDESSGVSEEHRGKYLAFTEHGTTNSTGQTTGIDYLKNLGMTYVQLLPIQDFAYLDEQGRDGYNWGYGTKNYNVPEGSYSVDPYHGEVRIKETKEMIQSLHDEGIGVIMDVVYNHVFDASGYCFNKLVPDYFTRIAEDGTYSNGSYCYNDTASERSMVKKYIVDSLIYWMEEYHVDGFRFDLVGILDTETINEIVTELRASNPSVLLYGEGWTLPTVSTKSDTIFATQENAELTPGFGYFDDRIRGRVKGENNDTSDGYATSGKNPAEIEKSVVANADWTQDPTQIINYVSCHDDLCLWDKLNLAKNDETREQLIQQNKLTSAIVLAAQGTPFIHAGDELLRTKTDENGNVISNSYVSSDFVNSIRWNDLQSEEIQKVSAYYKGLIAFRNAHKALRMTSESDIAANLSIRERTGNVVSYEINGSKVEGETAERILIAFNPEKTVVSMDLPEGEWSVCVNGQQAGDSVIETVSGTLQMEPISAYMLIKGENTVEEQNYVTVYYKSSNFVDCMLYGLFGESYPEDGQWSVIDNMTSSSYAGYKMSVINVTGADSVQVCFNDGNDVWDNNNGLNYTIGLSGSYMIKDGAVVQGEPTTEGEKPTEEEEEPTTEGENPTEEEEEPTTEGENPTEEKEEPTTEVEKTTEEEEPSTEGEKPTEEEEPTTEGKKTTEEEKEATTEGEKPTEEEEPTTEGENPTEEEEEPTTEGENPTEEEEEPTTEGENPTEEEEEPTTEGENLTEEKEEATTEEHETATTEENKNQTSGNNNTQTPGVNDNQNTGNTNNPISDNAEPSVKIGDTFEVKGLCYQITKIDGKNSTVTLIKTNNKWIKKLTVQKTVKYNEVTYKVTVIADKAFRNCKKLKTVVIGKNVTTIGKSAFKGCKNLKTVTIKSKQLSKVGSKAFSGIKLSAKIKTGSNSMMKKYKKLLKNKVPKSARIVK